MAASNPKMFASSPRKNPDHHLGLELKFFNSRKALAASSCTNIYFNGAPLA